MLFAGNVCANTMKEVYKNDFLIGAAVGERNTGHPYKAPMRRNPRELAVLRREFNCITAENIMKWMFLHPKKGRYYFEAADELVEFAEANQMDVVGHVLVWHAMVPHWVFEDAEGKMLSREALIKRMREHIFTVMGHYKGRIKYWDVVNEAVDTRMVDDGRGGQREEAFLRDSKWLQIIGEDFIEMAFRFAHEADPNALLLYNDYSMTKPAKADFVVQMIKRIRSKNVQVDGVGMQAHWHLKYPLPDELQKALDVYRGADLKVHITELDVGVLPLAHAYRGADISKRVDLIDRLNPYEAGIPDEVLSQQAERYGTFFEVLLRNRDMVERVTFWGIGDGESWLNTYPVHGRTAYPMPFDRNFEPKPAHAKILEVGREFVR